MAAVSSAHPTLLDWAKSIDPNGKIADIAELLHQKNEILTDAVFMEGNQETGHRITQRTGLPTTYWRAMNQGIPPSKSTKVQVDEAIGQLETMSEVDVDIAKLNGEVGAFRYSEAQAHLESMAQEMADTMFYGSTASSPEEFNGLAVRYNSTTAGAVSQNVLTAGGAGADNTSIWLVCWGPQTIFCAYPKGSSAGLVHEDMGVQLIHQDDSASGYTQPARRMRAYVEHFQWKCGLVVKDWRYAVRIANIDTSDVAGQVNNGPTDPASGNPDRLTALMARALDRIPSAGMGKMAFYMNRTAFSGLKILAMDQSQSVLAVQPGLSQFGSSPNATMTFLGIPIRICDALHNAEGNI